MLGMHWNWFPFAWFGGLGFLGIVAAVVIVIVLVNKSNNRPRDFYRPSNAEQILKERLAKGEINEEEYENLLKKVR